MSTTATEASRRNGVDVATLFATLDAVKNQQGDRQVPVPSLQHLGERHPQPLAAVRTSTAQCRRCSTSTSPRSTPTILRFWLARTTDPRRSSSCLHAIAACLTSGVANIAAARRVDLHKVTSTVEGDIDLLGLLGLSDGTVRNGYQQIRVTFHIEGDADDETLRGLVEQSRRRSAVYDALTNPTPVVINVITGK